MALVVSDTIDETVSAGLLSVLSGVVELIILLLVLASCLTAFLTVVRDGSRFNFGAKHHLLINDFAVSSVLIGDEETSFCVIFLFRAFLWIQLLACLLACVESVVSKSAWMLLSFFIE